MPNFYFSNMNANSASFSQSFIYSDLESVTEGCCCAILKTIKLALLNVYEVRLVIQKTKFFSTNFQALHHSHGSKNELTSETILPEVYNTLLTTASLVLRTTNKVLDVQHVTTSGSIYKNIQISLVPSFSLLTRFFV